MATVRNSLARKIARVLRKRFPPPDTVKVEDHHGIIGVITSESFAGMDGLDRQELIGEIISEELTKDECERVQVIVGVTPDEETGYLASAI